MRSAFLLSASAALLCGCGSETTATPPASTVPAEAPLASAAAPAFTLEAPDPEGAEAAELRALLGAGVPAVEAFFGLPFAAPVDVVVFGDRASFDASFPPEWGMGASQCWMVASGVADKLRLLSPEVWEREACEHDPNDALHVRNLIVHELVHVFHGQHNPTGDFEGLDDLGWFLEGLATYASGQLSEGHVADPREALELGLVPERLSEAWSGKYRYGVCGSLVEFIDLGWGREVLCEMLAATTQSELLAPTGLTEEELLADWEADLRTRREE